MTTAKILVVDDEPQFERLVLQRFRRKVRSKRYDFIFANNGTQALERLSEHKDICIILTDINMPQMDGLTFLSRLSEEEVPIKAVMVSAYGDMGNIRAAMNRGAFDFVTKPIDFDDLEITIEKAVKEIEAIKEAELAQEKLKLLQQELAVAKEIQQSFLPQRAVSWPDIAPYELYARMIPAREVGGDLYDYFFIDDDHLGLVIGDAAGKGMPAALFMAVSRTLIKSIGLKHLDPAYCMNQVNILLSQENSAGLLVTVFYAVLNIRNGVFTYCSAGHNPPIVLQASGSISELDDSQNMALGIEETLTFTSARSVLNPGDTLLLYTDGVTEAENSEGQFFQTEGLKAFLGKIPTRHVEELSSELIREVSTFSGQHLPADDLTVMVIHRLAVAG